MYTRGTHLTTDEVYSHFKINSLLNRRQAADLTFFFKSIHAHLNFSTLSANGSQTQIILGQRTDEDTTGPDVNSEIQSQCLIKERDTHFGASIFCSYLLIKFTVIKSNN